MTLDEAQRVLMLFRPGVSDPSDEEFAEAVALARTHAELRAWFEQHCAFQTAMRDKFRQVEVPPGLKAQLDKSLTHARKPRWQRHAPWLAAAAAVVLLAVAGTLLLGPRKPDRFADYRSRMVRTGLGVYPMDIFTKSIAELRRYHASRGAPSDYALSPKLEKLSLTGGALIQWRSNPVAMACFDRGDKQMIFLFVMKRSAVKDSPPAVPAVPQVTRVKSLVTVSWTQDDNTYLLAGPEEPDFPSKYR